VLDDEDGKFLEELIMSQAENGITYEVDENEYAKHLKHKVRRADGEIKVSVPQDVDNEEEKVHPSEIRESAKIQALIAKIGSQMGLRIWLPKNDRSAVLSKWNAGQDELPDNFSKSQIAVTEKFESQKLCPRDFRWYELRTWKSDEDGNEVHRCGEVHVPGGERTPSGERPRH